MQTKLRAIKIGTTDEVDIQASEAGEMRVSQFLPPYAQLCAAGKLFGINMCAGTAIAPKTSMPTTVAGYAIYNANPDGGAHIVLVHAAVTSASGTMGLGLALIGCVAIGAQTQQVANYSGAIVSCLDGSAKKPNLFIATAVTLLGTQSAWQVLAAGDQTATAGVGTGRTAFADGMLIVPPGGAIGLEVVAPTGTTALFDMYAIVAQVKLDT